MSSFPAVDTKLGERLPCPTFVSRSNAITYVRQAPGGQYDEFQSRTVPMRTISVQQPIPYDEPSSVRRQVVDRLEAHMREAVMNLLVKELALAGPQIRYALSGDTTTDLYESVQVVRASGLDADAIIVPRSLSDPAVASDALWACRILRWIGVDDTAMFIGPWKAGAIVYHGDPVLSVSEPPFGEPIVATLRLSCAPVILRPDAFVQLDLGEPV